MEGAALRGCAETDLLKMAKMAGWRMGACRCRILDEQQQVYWC